MPPLFCPHFLRSQTSLCFGFWRRKSGSLCRNALCSNFGRPIGLRSFLFGGLAIKSRTKECPFRSSVFTFIFFPRINDPRSDYRVIPKPPCDGASSRYIFWRFTLIHFFDNWLSRALGNLNAAHTLSHRWRPIGSNTSGAFGFYSFILPASHIGRTLPSSRFRSKILNTIATARQVGERSARPSSDQMNEIDLNLFCLLVGQIIYKLRLRNFGKTAGQHLANDIIFVGGKPMCVAFMNEHAIAPAFANIKRRGSICAKQRVDVKIAMLYGGFGHRSSSNRRVIRGPQSAANGCGPRFYKQFSYKKQLGARQ
jgi:hypothetical protein